MATVEVLQKFSSSVFTVKHGKSVINISIPKCRVKSGTAVNNPFLSYFFVKKIPLSRRVEYVMDGSMDESVSQ